MELSQRNNLVKERARRSSVELSQRCSLERGRGREGGLWWWVCGLLLEEVGAEAAGALEGLFVFPLGDFCFVSREQDLWDFPAFVDGGAGVDGAFQEVVLEGV